MNIISFGFLAAVHNKRWNQMIAFLKKEKVMTIAFILAIVSAFFVTPDEKYLDYIDLRVLALLFCLMLIVKGFQDIGLFDLLIRKVFGRVKSSRMLSLMLIMLCFFLSMLITNDVALITFVPFAILALRLCHQEKLMIRVIVLQTIAANLGSMLTPIGNPQNLYLFTASGMGAAEFLATMAPVAAVSLALLCAAVLTIPNESICIGAEASVGEKKLSAKLLTAFCILFAVNLLVVFRVISWIPALVITVLGVVIIGKWKLLAKVDYALLLTFVGFFVFVGNIGRIPEVSGVIESLLNGREIVMSVVFSQFLSNVPAALLLSGFTDRFRLLLLGTNIGGLGTLIASMASLISYKLYAASDDSRKGKYMLVFTAWNLIFLAVLLCFALVIY